MIDDKKIKVNKEVHQGSVLSPSLFNIYLEWALESVPELKAALEAGKIIAFADDLLLICDTKVEASALIEGIKNFKY